jgi:hypothetical protein
MASNRTTTFTTAYRWCAQHRVQILAGTSGRELTLALGGHRVSARVPGPAGRGWKETFVGLVAELQDGLENGLSARGSKVASTGVAGAPPSTPDA